MRWTEATGPAEFEGGECRSSSLRSLAKIYWPLSGFIDNRGSRSWMETSPVQLDEKLKAAFEDRYPVLLVLTYLRLTSATALTKPNQTKPQSRSTRATKRPTMTTTKNVIQQSTLCPSSAATASFVLRSSITDSHIQRSTVETSTLRATDIVGSTAAQSDVANSSILTGCTVKFSKVVNSHLQACKVEHCELINCSFDKRHLDPGTYVGNVLQPPPAQAGVGQESPKKGR